METMTSQMQQGMAAWKKLFDEQLQRFATVQEEMAKAEVRHAEQVRAAIDEQARMMKESLAYAAQLSAEWRRLSLEAVRRTTDLVPSATTGS